MASGNDDVNGVQVPTSSRPGRVRLFRGVLLVALALSGTASGWCALGRRADERREPARDAGAEFVAAWQRSLSSTYRAEGRFRRTVAGEQLIDDPLVIVQRRPDRITLGFGSWDGVVGGRAVHCEREGRTGPFVNCYTGEPADQVALDRAEMEEIRSLVLGPQRRYDVGTSSSEGCYQVVGRPPVPLATRFGDRAEVCFDPSTGARRRVRVERADAVDITILSEITDDVGASEFPEVSTGGT